MDMKEIYRFEFYTPAGPLKFPDLLVPKSWDADEQKAVVDWTAGSYSAKVVLPSAAVAKLQGQIEEYLEAFAKITKADRPKTKAFPLRPVFGAELDDAGDPTGNVIISARMKAQFENKKTGQVVKQAPILVDSAGNIIPRNRYPGAIWGGTVAALKCTLNPYVNNDAKAYCMAYRLKAVQLIKLVGPGEEDVSGFGAVEGGYVAQDTDWSPTDGDAGDNTNDGVEEDKSDNGLSATVDF